MALRQDVIRRYISSSAGVHVTVTEVESADYVRSYRRYLKGWLPAGGDRRWLDLGCGQGQLMMLAQKLGFAEISGVDASEEMVAAARRAGLSVKCGEFSSELRATRDGSVDVVSCFDLLEHLTKEEGYELLRDCGRILKPGGVLLLKLPNAYSPLGFGITSNDLTHEAAYTEATITQISLLAGFSTCAVREIGPQPMSIPGVARWLLWQLCKAGLKCYDAIETGRPRAGIYTRVMLARLEKKGT